MSKASDAAKKQRRKNLERMAIKAGLARYREHYKKFGIAERERFDGTKRGWSMLLAFKALHEDGAR